MRELINFNWHQETVLVYPTATRANENLAVSQPFSPSLNEGCSSL